MIDSSSSDASVLVAVATYKRPGQLETLLQSLRAMVDPPEFEVLVVDNDALGSAATVAQRFDRVQASTGRVSYVIEPDPGIVAARNAAVRFGRRHKYIAFVDDDEVVDPDWLAALWRTADMTGADVVSGPVDYIFDAAPPSWAVRGGFFTDPREPELATVGAAATNNMLLRVDCLSKLGIAGFDQRFGLTGGSDIMLSRQIVARGGRIVWTNSAVVSESTGGERLTARWLIRRAIRGGNTDGRVSLTLLRESGGATFARAHVGAAGLLRVLSGAVQLVTHPVITRSNRGASGFRRLLRGVGMVRASLGSDVVEYSRET